MQSHIVHIKEPFHKAGTVWDFNPPAGVGIDMRYFDGEGHLLLRLGDSPDLYAIDKMVARRFIKEKQSVEYHGRVCLWVLPLSLFKLILEGDAS